MNAVAPGRSGPAIRPCRSPGVLARAIRSLAQAVTLACALLAAIPAAAHPVPFSYIDLEIGDDAIEGRMRVHLTDLAPVLGLADPQVLLERAVLGTQRAAMQRYLASRIALGGLSGGPRAMSRAEWGAITIVDDNDALQVEFRLSETAAGSLSIDTNLFPRDPYHQTFINIYEEGELRQQFILSADAAPATFYRGTTAGALAVMATFVPAGVEHILIGPDHILFLIGLLLLGGSLRRLVVIVTAFTIGHSVTLSLAALNWLMPPAWLIEPAIALSIVVVGVDNLMQRQSEGRDLRAWLAGAFGLIHGFGFASVLREFGLPQEALGWSLFSFNVGVELGQLAIVLVAASILTALRRRFPAADKWIVVGGSMGVIAAGAWWFAERVFFGGG